MTKPMTRRAFLTLSLTAAGTLAGCALPAVSSTPGAEVKYRAPVIPLADVDGSPLVRSEEEWQVLLSPLQFLVMREEGTERAFTGEYDGFEAEGVYYCSACGNPLFSSETKYESGTGWPSYWMPITETAVIEKDDTGMNFFGTEVRCARCDSHLGHVFTDGPQPTGLRYCMNSIALNFEPESS